jgi:hypothetical protein
MTTEYICSLTPYKKFSWFKRVLIWLKICKNPNKGTFTLVLNFEGYQKGDGLICQNNQKIYIYGKNGFEK